MISHAIENKGKTKGCRSYSCKLEKGTIT